MKKKKNILTKGLVLLFSAALLAGSLSSSVKASEVVNLKDLPKDTVLAIVDGVEITPEDVTETGYIKDGVLPEMNSNGKAYLPVGKTQAFLQKKLSYKDPYYPAGNWNQQTDLYYYNKTNAVDVAFNLTRTSVLQVIFDYLIGFLPGKNTAYAVAFYSGVQMLSSLDKTDLSNRLYDTVTQNGYTGAVVKFVKSKYGTLYRVDGWDGKTLDYSTTNSGNTTESVYNEVFAY